MARHQLVSRAFQVTRGFSFLSLLAAVFWITPPTASLRHPFQDTPKLTFSTTGLQPPSN